MITSMRRSFFVLFLALVLSARAEGGKPLPPKELAEFLGPVSPKAIAWTKSTGADFDAYVGRAMAPLSGTVNLYIGGWPHFKTNAASAAVTGRLGLFPVTWHRKVAPDGTISQEAVFQLYGLWKVDVWLEAKRQSDIDGMIAILTRMPTFTEKPKPVSSR
jgi:hypothetical protein